MCDIVEQKNSLNKRDEIFLYVILFAIKHLHERAASGCSTSKRAEFSLSSRVELMFELDLVLSSFPLLQVKRKCFFFTRNSLNSPEKRKIDKIKMQNYAQISPQQLVKVEKKSAPLFLFMTRITFSSFHSGCKSGPKAEFEILAMTRDIQLRWQDQIFRLGTQTTRQAS